MVYKTDSFDITYKYIVQLKFSQGLICPFSKF